MVSTDTYRAGACPQCQGGNLRVVGRGEGRECLGCGLAFHAGIWAPPTLAEAMIAPDVHTVTVARGQRPACPECAGHVFQMTDGVMLPTECGLLFTVRCVRCLESLQVCQR